ncbi:MAG: GNAT family N-acetyltransferase [Dinghuibacter sp.]|nr:GNAT family N-acetyltransferase [Dinghuibacter sp.]
MNELNIIPVTPNEVHRLQQISRQTFSETFSASNSDSNMNQFLEEAYATGKLLSELNNPNSRFYFAMHGNRELGYLKLNFGAAQTELKDGQAVEIERIYVLHEFLGKKVGQALYEHAVQQARQANARYIWLGVWEENPRAISFYKKNGFVEFDKHIFRLGTEEQTDIMMKLELHAG